MVLPLLIGAAAGAQVASGIMQYYQAEKARKATDKRLKEIEAMFDSIVPPEYNIKIWDDPSLTATIPAPAFDLNSIKESEYKSVGQYVPEVANFVQEAKPELVKATANAQEGRQAQLDALKRYKDIAAAGGMDPELAQQLSLASSKARNDAQSRQDSVVQDANRRGQAGSGVALAAQLSGASAAMQRQATEGQSAAVAAYRNKLGALDKSAALGGDIRSSEMGEEARNVGIINDFNQRTATRGQAWENARAGAIGDARLRNLNSDQQLSNMNVDRSDKLQQANFNNLRANRQDKMDVEDRKNRLKQQVYDNLMSKAQGKAGLAQTSINYGRQDASDRNKLYQGLGDTATNAALLYGMQQQQTPSNQTGAWAGYDAKDDDDTWRTA